MLALFSHLLIFHYNSFSTASSPRTHNEHGLLTDKTDDKWNKDVRLSFTPFFLRPISMTTQLFLCIIFTLSLCHNQNECKLYTFDNANNNEVTAFLYSCGLQDNNRCIIFHIVGFSMARNVIFYYLRLHLQS